MKEKSAVTKAPAVNTSKPQPTKDPLITEQKAGYFTIAAKDSAASLYLDAKGEDYDGLSLIAASVAKDISLVTKEKAKANVVTKTESLKEYAIIAGSIGNNAVIDSLIEQGKVDASQIKGKREVYRIQVVENPVANVKKQLSLSEVINVERFTVFIIFLRKWVFLHGFTGAMLHRLPKM